MSPVNIEQGLGGRLLLAAAIRGLAVAEQVGGAALLIDAAGWYRGYGAVALEDAQLSLILPLNTIAAAAALSESGLALIGDRRGAPFHYPDGVPAFA